MFLVLTNDQPQLDTRYTTLSIDTIDNRDIPVGFFTRIWDRPSALIKNVSRVAEGIADLPASILAPYLSASPVCRQVR